MDILEESMTEIQIAAILAYVLIGVFLADIFFIRFDIAYILFALFYPLVVVGFFVLLGMLWTIGKLYEVEERLG